MTPEELDLACWPIFAAMTERGIAVDMERLTALRTSVTIELEVQEAALQEYAGAPLNPYSPAEVAKWLAAEGLSGGRRTRGGATATDERALSLVADQHPVPGCVLECRGLRKLLSTFIEPILERLDVERRMMARPLGIVHPRWRLTKVKSGRPSMEDPNLLAFPKRDAWGRKVRECFVARRGHKLVSVDFAQIEPRVAAALSGDEALCKVFASGQDLYADMARRLFKLEHVSPPITDGLMKSEPWNTRNRQPAKIILLGCVLYGMQADHLYDELIKYGCGTPSEPYYDHEACERFVAQRFEPYPGLADLLKRTVAAGRADDGWVQTQGGRRRFLPALLVPGSRWPAAKLREEAERQALNHLIQGTAQEVMKRAMLGTAQGCSLAFPILQVYDEMIYEVDEGHVDVVGPWLQEIMESWMEVRDMDRAVRVKASWAAADTWAGLK